ncbi:MAG: MarR family EPS-associated transcriptional regulator [Sphingomonadaceae bacterium]|nr:MarR family EPS-associated transcriptional regulator [Sphingomonadaceae bacterium]
MSLRAQKEEDERTRLLRLIGADPSISQREIARHLGLSVGKVHYLLKALADKGIVKVHSFKNSQSKIGYAYYLTPRGIGEKARLTRRFLLRKLAEYDALSEDIEMLRREVASDPDGGTADVDRAAGSLWTTSDGPL